MVGRAARHLVALLIPGLDDVGVGCRQHPLLRARQKRVARHDLVDQSRGLGPGRIAQLALEQKRRRRHRAHLAHQPRRAAHAGEDADHDLGQADLGLRVVGREDAVAGQRNLVADAKGGAGQGGGDGLAAFQRLRVHAGTFDLAQDGVLFHQPVEEAAGRVAAGLVLHPCDDVEVHAAGKAVLARGDDHALHGIVGQRLVDQPVEFVVAFQAHHVHRLRWHVPGDGGDAIGIHVIGEIGHLLSSSKGVPSLRVKVAAPSFISTMRSTSL